MSEAPIARPADKSVIRNLRKQGDQTRDGRGHVRSMPPLLQYGFRPFFLLAAIYAGLAVPIWLWMYFAGFALPGPFDGLQWHVHEMLFGYLSAVITGFILTAIPNWTGRLPLSGWPLAGLILLWVAGRLACAFVSNSSAAMVIDLAFPALLAFAIWREVIAGKNWKNFPVAAMVTLMGIANLLFHVQNMGVVAEGTGTRLALATSATLIALIGGRIIPSFTRNWLVKNNKNQVPPASFGMLDKTAMGGTIAAAIIWAVAPHSTVSGVLLLLAGALLLLRLWRWRGGATIGAPIVFILHLGYAWLGLSLVLLGASRFTGAIVESSALHALTAGAIGTMTLAVMTRASLGHTGREIVANPTVVAVYCAVTLGAVLRVIAPYFDEWYLYLLGLGGVLWSGAFLLFALHYAPILCKKRRR